MQIRTSLQTDNHASTPPLSFLQAGCPSFHPTNSVKALKAKSFNGNQFQAFGKIGEMQHHETDFPMETIKLIYEKWIKTYKFPSLASGRASV